MTITIPRVLIAASYVAALAGCPDRTLSRVPSRQGGTVTKKIATDAALDLLLVIDNSSSTADKQQLFADNFQKFTGKLAVAANGKAPDLHVGVVSTSVGLHSDAFAQVGCPAKNDDGLLQSASRGTCTTAPTTARYLADDGRGGTNFTGTLSDALTCIALLGSNGCGFEAQLEAMKLALDGSQPQNAGFLRDNAYLAIVLLTDEDDCSVVEGDASLFERTDLPADDFRCQPLFAYQCDTAISSTGPGQYRNCKPRTDGYLETIDHYYDFVVGLKDPSLIAVALIAGDPTPDIATGPLSFGTATQPLALQPSCSTTIPLPTPHTAIARPAIRLADFVSRFGPHGLMRTVCQPDYGGVIDDIAALLTVELSPCLEGPIDVSTGAPSCAVADVVAGVESVVPPCVMSAPDTPDPAGARPCWWVEANAAACATTETHVALHVERGAPPAPGTIVEASCQVVPAT